MLAVIVTVCPVETYPGSQMMFLFNPDGGCVFDVSVTVVL